MILCLLNELTERFGGQEFTYKYAAPTNVYQGLNM